MANENLMLNEDLNIIQKLGDEPNADNNLTASELKAKFDEAGNIIKRHINEVLVPDSTGKVPNTRKVNGKALSSDITLSASDVSARPNTWTPTAADVGAAPAGFGLGAGNVANNGYKKINHEQADNLWNTGVYWFADSENPYYPDPFNSGQQGLLIHLQHNYNNTVAAKQIFIPYYKANVIQGTGPDSYVVVERTKSDSEGWKPIEWRNPPLVAGLEYRTTERYNGKPVYAKLVDCGTFAAAGSLKTFTFDETATLDKLVSFSGVTSNGWQVPSDLYGGTYDGTGAVYVTAAISPYSGHEGSIYMYSKAKDVTGVSMMATVKYTKITD